MARPKSSFLGAWGTMYHVVKALVDEVLSIGGDDESIRLILTNKQVRESVARILVDAGKIKSEPESQVQPQPLLKPLGAVAIPATTEKFVAKDHFMVGDVNGVNISYVGEKFRSWFGDKMEESIGATELRRYQLLQPSLDSPIITEIGEDKVETTPSAIYALMKKQGKGESGTLLTNGYANIFYIRDVNGVLRTVIVRWDGFGWYVGAGSVEGPAWWNGGFQVFSSNS